MLTIVLAALAAGLVMGVGEAEREPSPLDGLPDGKDSTRVVELRAAFPETRGSTAVVLFESVSGSLRPSRGVLAEAVGAVGGPPAVEVSEDGEAALGIVRLDATGPEALSEAVRELRRELADRTPEGVTESVTGPAAVQADLAAVFEGADLRLLAATAAVVAVLLLITYRSPVLWLVPLAVVGVADRTAAVAATHALDAVGLTWDASTVGILSVLVFGAGTDYALLLISRYRDELKVEQSRRAAMARARRRTAEAVLASSLTVVVGVLCLLLSAFPTTRGLGAACAVGIAVAALAALVVLPAALVLCPRGVFWPLVPRVGQPTLVTSTSLWTRVGGVVAARPGTLVAAAVLGLVVLSVGLTQLRSGLTDAEQFLEEPESIAAAARLADHFPRQSADPTVVVARAAPDAVLASIGRADGAQPGRVQEGGNGLVRVDVVLDAPPGSSRAEDRVVDLRRVLAPLGETWVGGPEAESVDEEEAAAEDRRLIIPLVLGLVLLALLLLLRSLVAPVLLVTSVVGTYLAALGVSWWIFTGVLGFTAIDVGMPLLAYLFLVALGVDYNIFLVTRAAEESRDHGVRRGMLRALAATGGVITSAGILLAAVFAVLGVLPLVVLAQLGVVICVGVLLDTLLVRTVLVPALAVLLGDLFWWPRRFGAARR